MNDIQSYITTSWDDGHPLDFRIAELLSKHGLTGTFYIPREADAGVMPEQSIRELSKSFEIGAHTMRHVFLNTVPDAEAAREIVDSRGWVQDVTGNACPVFCPPGGKFSAAHLPMIERAGFQAMRSVELLSFAPPRRRGNLLIMPTTLQAHPHGLGAYVRNVLKRRALANLWLYVLHGHSTDWPALARSFLDFATHHGGVFHLWGHSWEIEANGQWERLDEVLGFMGEIKGQAPCLTNGELCEQFRVAKSLPADAITA
ncbi:MAG TPA: polysaccharide deacetylase family protein [Tepidisphaeraceae bacterium]|nr:polysaccharide deacetylase family protein [Tepidisphaeraceae bacterium]